jgi:hypothetical protein
MKSSPRTKKSPTPSTAKKTGAELPKDSPKGTPSSLPPDALARLEELRDVDPNLYHAPLENAEAAAQARVGALLGDEADRRACAVMDAFLADAMRNTSPEEILRRATSSEALDDVLLAARRAQWRARGRMPGTSDASPGTSPLLARAAEGTDPTAEERHRRTLAFRAACSRAFSPEGACQEEDPAQGKHRFVCLTCGLVTDLEHDDCRERADRFAGAPTLSAVAEIANATDQEPEDVVRTLVELGLRVLGRGDRNAYFDARRLWELLNFGAEA